MVRLTLNFAVLSEHPRFRRMLAYLTCNVGSGLRTQAWRVAKMFGSLSDYESDLFYGFRHL